MYEEHFGLKKRPFPAKAKGTDVFVGPQTAKTMAGLKKALASQDAVVTVSGPAGSGKTTLVAKALDALSDTHVAIRIGRMQLKGTDALEFLLEELGVEDLPRGPIRQFAALRTQLHALESRNRRLVIVIEDAVRIGADTVAELEALTAADAGDSAGAALVLMGDERLADFCREPQLSRLAQRIRKRLAIEALCAAEMRGYLMHSFRLAGADFELIFDDRSAALVHHLTDGIPRLANNIIESTLSAAATDGVDKISASFVAGVARNEFGLETGDFDLSTAEPFADPLPVVESKPAPEPEHVAEPDPVPELQPIAAQEPVAEPEPLAESKPAADPVIVFSDETDEGLLPDADDIPELIQDTMPDLEVLAPEFTAADTTEKQPDNIPELQPEFAPVTTADGIPQLQQAKKVDAISEPQPAPKPELVPVAEAAPIAELVPEPEPEPVLESEPEPEVVLEPEPEPELAAPNTEPESHIPDWDRDPTFAELKPDLDALEKAMAFAHGDADDDDSAPAPVADKSSVPAAPEVEKAVEEIPEITLDNAIQARVADNLIDEPGQISATDPETRGSASSKTDIPKVSIAPQKAKKADAELEKIAAELAKAKTIEDVDDKLAETLFGEEINLIAAQVVASGSAPESANDEELKLFDTAASAIAQTAGSQQAEAVAHEAPALEVLLEKREHGGEAGLDLSASQRLKTVQALNADLHPSLREPENEPPAAVPSASEPQTPETPPEPIEDQINTSITQTLKALNVTSPTAAAGIPLATFDDDEVEEKKGGFFSRFKRS